VSYKIRILVLGLILDLTKYASHVYVLVRKGELRASKIMAKRLVQHPKVTVMWNVSSLQPGTRSQADDADRRYRV
jgi:thioredoxin reductase (NADPH)